MRRPGAIGVMCLAAACGQTRDDEGVFGDGDGGSATSGPTSGATDDGGDDDAADSVGDSAGDGPILDVGSADDGLTPGEGCQKIDFLFVVDNSGSMGAHQAALLTSFGPFMDTIFGTVQAQDYHVMIVDSDAGDDIMTCEPCSPDSFWCGNYCDVAPMFGACETTLGAGEIQPYNFEASNAICGVPGGIRYLTSDTDQAQLKTLFQCMGKVGTFGSGAEMPMSAMVEAVTTQSAADGCNEGFLRSDAILVVTFISDDYPVPGTNDNASTVGSPPEWFDGVVQAKGGKVENVVMLGITNTADAACVSGAGDPIVHPTQRFVDFVGMFGARGLTANICSAEYNSFFQEAVGLIDTACDEFEPEG